MVNAHSHAFQRALRGLGERPAPEAHAGDDFWSWREAMYRLAGELDPESMGALAARTYREMAAAGYGAVGEFHYVHHRPDGTPYDDPNAMAVAVGEAALAAGLAVTLLPAAYHRAGWDEGHLPPAAGQLRFCDPSPDHFLARVDELREWAASRPGALVGVAAHSVRAVPADWLGAIAAYADSHGLVRHVHAAEQRRELEECEREHGCSPIELLERTGFLGERTSVVHGIHVSPRDVELLARQPHDRRLLSHHRRQPRRRSSARAGLPRRGGQAGHRQRFPGADRPLRGGARARDRGAPGGPDPARPARLLG